MVRSTKDLLQETYRSIPNNFAYREVRFYVYTAMQRLETLEKREAVKAQQRVEEEERKKNKEVPAWMPPIYQNPSQVQNTIDILDKMISEEKKVIEEIHAKRAQKGQTEQTFRQEVEDEDYDDDEQMLQG